MEVDNPPGNNTAQTGAGCICNGASRGVASYHTHPLKEFLRSSTSWIAIEISHAFIPHTLILITPLAGVV